MNFVFKFDPDTKFDPKNAFFNFFKLVILPVLLLDLKCSTVCRANRIYCFIQLLYGNNPFRVLNQIGFHNFEKVEFWLKKHFENIV